MSITTKARLSTLLFSIVMCASSHAAVISETELSGAPGFNDSRESSQSLDGFFSDQSGSGNIFPNATNDSSAPIFPSVTINGRISSLPALPEFNFAAIADIDFYSFNGTGGTTAFFDIDVDRAGLLPLGDSFLSLFDSTGTLLAVGDDIATRRDVLDPGSTSSADGFIGNYILPSTGRYFIVVNDFGNSQPNATSQSGLTRTALTRPDGVTDENSELSLDDDNVSVAGATPDDSFQNFGGSSDTFQQGDYTLNVSLQQVPGNPAPVPEPGTMALMGVGLASLVAARRRKKEKPVV